jgi:TolA-binding protein
MEELLVTEQPPNPAQPTESTLALSFLREDIQNLRQDMRQDIRQIHGRIDQTNGRIDQTNGRIDDLAKQLDSRYARLMAMLIACTSILVTTMGAAVAVLK